MIVMIEKPFRIKLLLGDVGGDGHEIHSEQDILSNMSKRDMLVAYEKGAVIAKFDPMNELCSAYKDSKINIVDLKNLISLGFNATLENKIDENNSVHYIGTDDFVKIVLFIIQLGDNTFKYNLVEKDFDSILEIGGYGLFKN